MLVPKIVTSLRGYTRQQLFADLTSGVVVGIVALPLAIAFAIASGVTPDRGLYSAIIAGFLISLLGGSKVQIGGPTGAFVVIVYSIVQTHGVDGLLVATAMAGIILIGLGVARLGRVIQFIPYPVVTGFTSGIALIIFSTQVRDLLGLRMEEVPASFIAQWAAYAAALPTFNAWALAVAALALAILIVWPRYVRWLPAPIVALVAVTVLVRAFGLPVETLGDRFGEISSSLPRPRIPAIDLDMLRELLGPAFAIAMLAGIESLLSAVVADGMIDGHHRSDMELVAQGVANVVTPIFGGIPATGAIARTATNVRNGGRTPIAGIAHAVTVLLITLFFGGLVGYIPFAALAAILVMVAYHMSEWRSFRIELSAPRSDVFVLITTFVLTVAFDLVIAIQVGMILAAFLFMRRMAEVTDIQAITGAPLEEEDAEAAAGDRAEAGFIPKGVEVYEINGPFFFGAAQKFRERVESLTGRPRVLIVRMRKVPAVDSTALHALRNVVRQGQAQGMLVLLSELQPQPLRAVARSVTIDQIGEENLHSSFDEALLRAREHIAAEDLIRGR